MTNKEWMLDNDKVSDYTANDSIIEQCNRVESQKPALKTENSTWLICTLDIIHQFQTKFRTFRYLRFFAASKNKNLTAFYFFALLSGKNLLPKILIFYSSAIFSNKLILLKSRHLLIAMIPLLRIVKKFEVYLILTKFSDRITLNDENTMFRVT